MRVLTFWHGVGCQEALGCTEHLFQIATAADDATRDRVHVRQTHRGLLFTLEMN